MTGLEMSKSISNFFFILLINVKIINEINPCSIDTFTTTNTIH